MLGKRTVSISPVSSSSVMKTTVTPLLVGGRMRQITVPAVVIRAPCGSRARAATVRGRYGANCSRNSTVGWTVGERPSTSTSHFTRSKREGGGILDFGFWILDWSDKIKNPKSKILLSFLRRGRLAGREGGFHLPVEGAAVGLEAVEGAAEDQVLD